MPKFRRELASLQEPLDFWLYFFQNGKELDADALPDPLARPEICQAMEVLKVSSQSELERDRYENRLKASRDQQAMMEERDEAIQERQQAEEKLRQAERLAKQNVSRRIQLCQRVLGQAPTPSDQLLVQSIDELCSLADQLEQQLPAL